MKYAVIYYNDYDFSVEVTMFDSLDKAQEYMKHEYSSLYESKKEWLPNGWCVGYDAVINCDDENDCWKIVLPKTA